MFLNLLKTRYTSSTSAARNLSTVLLINPRTCSTLGLSPSCDVCEITSPPIRWKNDEALVPMSEKDESIPFSLSAITDSKTTLNRLLFNPPHNPLSEETTIYPLFLISLTLRKSDSYSG